jgi:hypothetical protein
LSCSSQLKTRTENGSEDTVTVTENCHANCLLEQKRVNKYGTGTKTGHQKWLLDNNVPVTGYIERVTSGISEENFNFPPLVVGIFP